MIHRSPFFKSTLLLAGLSLSSSVLADTLQQAIECAMRLNPDVRFAAAHRWTTEEQLKQQKAGYLPSLDLTAGEGFENSNNPTAVAVFKDNDGGLRRTESSLTLDENLFAGFATQNEVRRLKETVKAAAYKAGGTSEDVALSVTEQYLEVLRRQKLVKLAQQNLTSHQGLTGMMNQRTDAGIGRKADSNQAEGRLALANANLIAEKGNLVDAETEFLKVVGEAPKHLVQPKLPVTAQLPATVEQAIAEAIANHPTLKSANADIAAARAQHESSKSTNYPHLDLILSASRNRNLDGQPGVNNDELAMVRGSWNLFKGGQDQARQRETAYQTQEAEEVRNRTLWQVQESMRLSWNAWKESAARLTYLQQHQELAKRTVDAYSEQFKLSQRSLLDLVDAENEYYHASSDYITGQYTEMYARYRILNSMGKLMDTMGVSRPLEANLIMAKSSS